MTDPFSQFEDLHEPGSPRAPKDYPGKVEPVNRQVDNAQPSKVGWDEKPTVYAVNGVAREYFSIRHLSAALGRSPVTIRAWENSKKLPKSPFRTQVPHGEHLAGKTPKGRRLWTREQIEGILRIAEEEECILNGTAPTAQFSARVQTLFTELLDKERLNNA